MAGATSQLSLPAGLPTTTIYLMGLILLLLNEFRGVYPKGERRERERKEQAARKEKDVGLRIKRAAKTEVWVCGGGRGRVCRQ